MDNVGDGLPDEEGERGFGGDVQLTGRTKEGINYARYRGRELCEVFSLNLDLSLNWLTRPATGLSLAREEA
jgi:hypothetical protein